MINFWIPFNVSSYSHYEIQKRPKKIKRGFGRVWKILKILEAEGVKGIPDKMKPHLLKGKYKNNWECQIKSDRLIIWIQIEEPGEIKLVRPGSHSDLFK